MIGVLLLGGDGAWAACKPGDAREIDRAGLVRIADPESVQIFADYRNRFADGRWAQGTSIGIKDSSGKCVAALRPNIDHTMYAADVLGPNPRELFHDKTVTKRAPAVLPPSQARPPASVRRLAAERGGAKEHLTS